MDINLLVVNVGNTRTAVGVFVAGALDFTTRIPHTSRTDWAGKIADAWKRIEGLESASIAGASVNPTMAEPLELVIQQTTGHAVHWVGRELDIPIEVKTELPAETGIDRILNVAAAYEQMGKACVVVDAGSALTVDLCDDGGAFLGGAILPGADMMLSTLHERTAKLPEVALAKPSGDFGANTTQAMLHGVYIGTRGAVRELVESYATSLHTWPELIATGGDAELLFGGWELVHAVSPDLTLYGIALAYTNHHITHDE